LELFESIFAVIAAFFGGNVLVNGHFSPRYLTEQCFDKQFGFEFFEVFGFFAETDEFNRDGGLVADGDDDAAFGGAVEFGQDDAGDVNGFGEHFRLVDGVLAGGGVEDEEDFVGGVFDFSHDDVSDFGEFAHEVVLGVESSGGVDEEDVGGAGDSGVAGVEGDGGGIAALLVFDDLDAGSFGPDGELFDGGGAEGIAGGEDYFFILLAEPGGEFGDAGGFSGAIDAGDHDDGGSGFGEV